MMLSQRVMPLAMRSELLLDAQPLVLQLPFEQEGGRADSAEGIADLMRHGGRQLPKLSHAAAPQHLVLRCPSASACCRQARCSGARSRR